VLARLHTVDCDLGDFEPMWRGGGMCRWPAYSGSPGARSWARSWSPIRRRGYRYTCPPS